MWQDPLFILVVVACLVVLVILMIGVGSFGKGGDWHRRNANRIMRWRIIAQAVAVLLILLFVAVRRMGGN
ncbi:twin transmembrane helix small protein [Psychromarinibacter sp. C21-152]|uniref:Twin transmembrane helix small protein n=1 Tax=Psychromarinibacter sediminicola TaxID=3033385 RepID=A0AAE3NNW6_9RHOB|nr:twin transmembrane helix small protein [Psychromarinibacter sediminicola]MDF0600793.1 twin transmembrane helix small protein [Psychromarinibacter sediminicola]